MEFKVGTATIRTINPEAIPNLKKNLAKLIIKMAQKEMDKEEQVNEGEDKGGKF